MYSLGLLSIVSIVIQVLLIIHCIKTGRSWIWIWVIALLSYVGIIAYVAVEIVPDLFRSRPARRAARGMKKALDPGADLRRYGEQARVTGGVAALQRYADELTRHGRFDEAIATYQEALKGLYAHDPNLLLGIARAQFGKGDASAARATLDELTRQNPDFRSPDAQLLHARALEAEGSVTQALEAYHALAPAYPGAEASVRYAQLLAAQGEHARAASVARDLLEQARIAPPHYRRAQRDWLDLAERLAAR
ncbi:MAG TPA: tetratricopeptide repeat protein [Steroidobacteraceae bacterium]|nr:tetratricopeptide repeat protein [Steroidobacteraceae bacterium]